MSGKESRGVQGGSGFGLLARVVVREFSWKRAVGLQKRGSGGSPPIVHLMAIFEDLHH